MVQELAMHYLLNHLGRVFALPCDNSTTFKTASKKHKHGKTFMEHGYLSSGVFLLLIEPRIFPVDSCFRPCSVPSQYSSRFTKSA